MGDYEAYSLTPEQEREVLEVYEALKVLTRDVKVPSVKSNCRMALSFMWQVVNNLGLKYEHIAHELGEG